jgi:diguanylate cyclase (GGDEF)-like protein
MALDLKKIKSLLVGGSATVSLIMAITAAVLLVMRRDLPGSLHALAVMLALFSLVPAASTLILVRALSRTAREAEQFATRDPLTKLYNQHTFWDLLQYETQRSKRQEYKFTLLLIDIDNFKVINDKYGHETGDRFLVDFSNILKFAVRKGDIPARYAGDDFAAILPVCDEEQAFVVARRIRDNLREHSLALPDGNEVQHTVSIGVAVFPSHAQDAQDLFLIADSMLRHAKDSGKDDVAFPSEQDNVEMLKNLGDKNIMILNAIRRRNMRIVPYFQPIMDLQNRSVAAYEVLTRIQIADHVIPAADFIEAAENMGAIGKIDYQLIEQAFAIVRQKNFRGTLFLNLSPKAMVISDFMPTVRSLFHTYGIEPGSMVFEITERDTVKNVSLFADFVRKLKDEGFRFAIDDFGAGYSSFQYLKTFPIDYLKVDGDFVRSMTEGGVTREIVTSIAQLATRLKIKTIAEYVETEAILGEVQTAGIQYAQGYFIQRPSPDLG